MGHLKKVDWESLAKNLQEALAREMKEVERLESEIARLNNIVEDYNGESLTAYSDNKNKNAIICYLENRLYEEMKKNRDRHEDIPF
jgi:hypothetical protein